MGWLVEALGAATGPASAALSSPDEGRVGSLPVAPGERHHADPTHLLSHQVKGVQLPLPPKVRKRSIERLLNELPGSVLRAKALVRLVEEPGARWLFERSGGEVSPSPTAVRGVTRLPSSLLCMGIELDENDLKARISEEFGVDLAMG